jgi:hypothetical protein
MTDLADACAAVAKMISGFSAIGRRGSSHEDGRAGS